MNTLNYIKEHGLESLSEDLGITIKEYDDRYVLNYNQIESPRFHPVCDECRGLIVSKDFKVLSRAFTRFYNLGEGIPENRQNMLRIASDKEEYEGIDISTAQIFEKVDGSLISFYFDGEKWCHSTRGMAFAEGGNEFSESFSQLVQKADEFSSIMEYLENGDKDWDTDHKKKYTYIFELTSPFNRIVTPYDGTNLRLLGVRNKESGQEIVYSKVEEIAKGMKCDIPKSYSANSWDEVISLVKSFPAMEEGVVLVWPSLSADGFVRIKCKNPSYVAIHSMRGNGLIRPDRILQLVMENEQEEYLQYFEEDRKYFDFITSEFNSFISSVESIYDELKDIEEQKEFALKVFEKIPEKWMSGFLFSLRKGVTLTNQFEKMTAKKLAKAMKLKEKFCKKFLVNLDND